MKRNSQRLIFQAAMDSVIRRRKKLLTETGIFDPLM